MKTLEEYAQYYPKHTWSSTFNDKTIQTVYMFYELYRLGIFLHDDYMANYSEEHTDEREIRDHIWDWVKK